MIEEKRIVDEIRKSRNWGEEVSDEEIVELTKDSLSWDFCALGIAVSDLKKTLSTPFPSSLPAFANNSIETPDRNPQVRNNPVARFRCPVIPATDFFFNPSRFELHVRLHVKTTRPPFDPHFFRNSSSQFAQLRPLDPVSRPCPVDQRFDILVGWFFCCVTHIAPLSP